jgi:DNA-binding MarR family transcriptional regulator
MADLSRKMGLDPSTLVASVDALVKKGYLKRERDPEDRRRYPLHVTESGTALLKHLRETFGADPLPAALEQLDDEEREQLQSLLGKVVMFLPEGEAALEEIETHLQMMEEAEEDC